MIILHNTDGIKFQLKDKCAIEKVQLSYANLLHKYLKSNHDDQVANCLFHQGLMFVHQCQRAYELQQYTLRF